MRAATGLPAIALLLAACAAAWAAELELRQVNDDSGRPTAFEAAGLTEKEAAALAKLPADDPAWPRILAVYVAGDAARGDLPPMLGTYAIRETALRFTPKYPLKGGLRYRVNFQPAAIGNPQAKEFPADRLVTVYITPAAAPRSEPTKVIAVFPSAGELPENQLRFYLHFSAPMSRGEVYQRVRLLDNRGQPVAFPFLEIGEELWDKSGTRLTLLIDPGRIKRGLRPREEDGPVLEAGKKYKLVIDKRWRDALGQPLAANHEKPFAVGAPNEKALDTADWKIEPPAAGSHKPLVVRFPAPLDHALLERTIDVVSAGGKSIAGEVTIADEEKTWRFTPDQPWRAGKHELAIDKTLEDLVGNRIGVPFEVDHTGSIDKRVKLEIHRVPFEVAGVKGTRPEVSAVLKSCRDLLPKIDDQRQRDALEQEILKLEATLLVKKGSIEEALNLAATSSNPIVALIYVLQDHWRETGELLGQFSDLSARDQRTFYELALRTTPPPRGNYEQTRTFLRRHFELSNEARTSSGHVFQIARLAESALVDNQPHEAKKILELVDELIQWPPANRLPPATALAAVSVARVWHRLDDQEHRERFIEIAKRGLSSEPNLNSGELALSAWSQYKTRLHVSLAKAYSEFGHKDQSQKSADSAWENLQAADISPRGIIGWQSVALELAELQHELADVASEKRTLSWVVDQTLNASGELAAKVKQIGSRESKDAELSPSLRHRAAKTIAWKMLLAGDIHGLEAFLAKVDDPSLQLSLHVILAQARFEADKASATEHLNSAGTIFGKLAERIDRIESARVLAGVCQKLGEPAKAARFEDLYEELAGADHEELRRRCNEYLASGHVSLAQSMVDKMTNPLYRAHGLMRIAAWLVEAN